MNKLLVMLSVLSLPVLAAVAQQPNRQPAFDQVFTLRGVKFNDAQQTQVDALRKKYTPQLTQLLRDRNDVYTDEQRRERRQAIQQAREAKKSREESLKLLGDAVKLTDQQQQQLAKLQQSQNELARKIQAELQALLTPEQRRSAARQNRGNAPGNRARRIAPTHADVKYGPSDRNVMDVWLAESKTPTPVMVAIHGGGFRGGNKSVDGNLLRGCLDSGISVVAITYRLSGEAIAPAQFYDSARAIQFIRHNAKDWNIDKSHFAATGGSAGAGISLWLGFHDDLADPDNADPVLRESTRLSCMSVNNGQTSYDPRFIRKLFPENDTYKESALAQLYDVDLDRLDDLPREKYELFELVSPINFLTKDDVPAQLTYSSTLETPISNRSIGIHHPRFGKVLKEKMDALGIECKLHTGSRRGDPESGRQKLDFLKKHLGK